MDDMPPNTSPQAETGRRAARTSGESVPVGRTEARSFSPETAQKASHESVGAARDLSKAAAETTHEFGERSREAAREVANSWRGAMDPFLAMQVEVNRWFDDLWRQTTGFSASPTLRAARPFTALSAAPMFGLPPIDLKESNEAYQLCAELPGLTSEDVDLQLQGDSLLLSGRKSEQKEDASYDYRISERRFGRFERRFPIPTDVDRSRVEAAFRDGVLTVTLPKTAEARRQGSRIEIKS